MDIEKQEIVDAFILKMSGAAKFINETEMELKTDVQYLYTVHFPENSASYAIIKMYYHSNLSILSEFKKYKEYKEEWFNEIGEKFQETIYEKDISHTIGWYPNGKKSYENWCKTKNYNDTLDLSWYKGGNKKSKATYYDNGWTKDRIEWYNTGAKKSQIKYDNKGNIILYRKWNAKGEIIQEEVRKNGWYTLKRKLDKNGH